MEFRSYAFTVRPKNGVPENSDLEKNVIRLLTKYKGFVASEMEDCDRHLHGQIFFDKPKRKHDFNKMLNVVCKRSINDWCYDQQRVLYAGTKIAYNDGWLLDYTNKPDSILLFNSLPDETASYYPSQEEQDSVKARADAVDKQLYHLFELWDQYYGPDHDHELAPNSEKGIALFLYDMMFVQKKIRVIKEKRKISEMRQSLYHYINGEGLNTIDKLKYMLPS
jgi:hypothetical protein